MNNHAARVDRLAREKPTIADTMPTPQELAVEIEKMKADPDYECKWSQRQLDGWVKQLEAELDAS